MNHTNKKYLEELLEYTHGEVWTQISRV